MRRTAALLAALAAAAPAAAHVINVHPVRAALRADGDLLRATIETNALSWRLAAAPPPGEPDFAERAAAYLRTHFVVSADGRALEPRVLGGRTDRGLWRSDLDERAVLHVAYDLPAGWARLSVRPSFYREAWGDVEGAGFTAPEGVVRDFRTLLRFPGGEAVIALGAPAAELPRPAVERSAVGRWMESAVIGVEVFFSVAGGVALLAALLLFPPDRRTTAASFAGVLAAAWAGAAWGPSGDRAELCLWAAVALAAAPAFCRPGRGAWAAAATAGAFFAGRLWALDGRAVREATAFSSLSWVGFAAGVFCLLSVSVGLARGVAAFYRRHFKHLTPDELARQSLFHRQVAARLLAIAALYGIFSPLWRGPR